LGYRAPFPAELSQVEYVKLYFHLNLSDSFTLPTLGLLQLRRELLQALKTLPMPQGDNFSRQLKQLLQPAIPDDPILLRQIQKPAPALVISPDPLLQGSFVPQQRIILPVFLVGSGINATAPFVRLLQHLGERGLHHNTGQFVLEHVEAEDGSGLRQVLWFANKPLNQLTPPINNLSWWLERQPFLTDSIRLEMITPLRLLRQGRPLFKGSFLDIFPFLLRRVTALLAGYSGFELFADPVYLISLADRVKTLENRLYWEDWRPLKKEQGGQNLGGLLGHLDLAGEELAELLWILQLGTLFNFGKGAPYGAGQYRLNYS